MHPYDLNAERDRIRLNFSTAVMETFAFLDRLGFRQTDASPTIVRYQKADLAVHVYHGRRSYELGFCRRRR